MGWFKKPESSHQAETCIIISWYLVEIIKVLVKKEKRKRVLKKRKIKWEGGGTFTSNDSMDVYKIEFLGAGEGQKYTQRKKVSMFYVNRIKP